jgi:hypothetical protein
MMLELLPYADHDRSEFFEEVWDEFSLGLISEVKREKETPTTGPEKRPSGSCNFKLQSRGGTKLFEAPAARWGLSALS